MFPDILAAFRLVCFCNCCQSPFWWAPNWALSCFCYFPSISVLSPFYFHCFSVYPQQLLVEHFKWRAADFKKSEAKVDAIQMLQELHTFEHFTLSVLFLSPGRSYHPPILTDRLVDFCFYCCCSWELAESCSNTNTQSDQTAASGCVDLDSNHSHATDITRG